MLGSRWLGISKPSYGIHGTTQPESIGQSVTEGCVRMRNEEVKELYILVPEGTEVVITD
ncbi:MAG: L,D-transpeptidase [Candidatus Omnitrophica bacterium]|nr:L,D-transpeptidase [Candidatus Omnitrophota bacterium]